MCFEIELAREASGRRSSSDRVRELEHSWAQDPTPSPNNNVSYMTVFKKNSCDRVGHISTGAFYGAQACKRRGLSM